MSSTATTFGAVGAGRRGAFPCQGRPLRLSIAIVSALALTGCAAGGYPAIPDTTPPPFDAFQAGMRLAPGMPLDVAILRIGWAPISAQTTTCGILAADESPCQVVTFGDGIGGGQGAPQRAGIDGSKGLALEGFG